MHNFLSILTLIFQFLFLLIFKLLSSLSESRVRLWNVWIKFYGWPHFVSLHHLRNQNSWIPGFCTCFPVSHKFDNFIIHCQSHASGYGSKACFIYQRKNLRFFWHKYFDGVSLCTFCQMLLVHYGSSSCLLSNFHLNDNFKLDRNDKLYKLRPLIDHLNKKFISCRTPREHLSVDESMIKFMLNFKLGWDLNPGTQDCESRVLPACHRCEPSVNKV